MKVAYGPEAEDLARDLGTAIGTVLKSRKSTGTSWILTDAGGKVDLFYWLHPSPRGGPPIPQVKGTLPVEFMKAVDSVLDRHNVVNIIKYRIDPGGVKLFNFGHGPVPAHRHPNGLGWVAETANVDESVFISAFVYDTATVRGNAKITGQARVYGRSHVIGDAEISDDARVYGSGSVYQKARVFGNATISDSASVYGEASVYGNANVFGDARVFGDAKVYENAKVYGRSQVLSRAHVFGDASVIGFAVVTGNALVHGKAGIFGDQVVTDEVSGKVASDLEKAWGKPIKVASGNIYWEALVSPLEAPSPGVAKCNIHFYAKFLGGTLHEVTSNAAFFRRRVEGVVKVLPANVPGSDFEGFETFTMKSTSLDEISPA
ncbi:MAG: hypothetical protein WC824_08175, partial [Bacteroidota bacterium]